MWCVCGICVCGVCGICVWFVCVWMVVRGHVSVPKASEMCTYVGKIARLPVGHWT